MIPPRNPTERDVPIGMNQQRVGLIDECAYYGT